MARWFHYLLFLLWISYLFVCGVLLFTRGFLLSRQALPFNSTCIRNGNCKQYSEFTDISLLEKEKYLQLDCSDKDKLRLLPSNEFTYFCKGSTRRIIWLMIDALKYDFAYYNKSIPDAERPPYQNRMPIFNELIQSLPNNSRLFKFIANPPTTTMQRLKGLTTGSLPTFIDAGLNFGTPEINEDNILNQIIGEGKNIVTMGDDVWTSLFPNRSIREYPYPSFNMFDLDTVDNAVKRHLKVEVYQKDWSLLIAHFLGVDHCGHAHGPTHPEMTRKLTEMNNVVRDVVDSMDDDTVLLVMGDHGMTATGDHGGESEDEVSSALFVYSPQPLLPQKITHTQSTVYQVDVVPTIAFLMGTAIPFSNLGKVILEAIPLPRGHYPDINAYVPYAMEALVANIEQIMIYINTYSRQTHLFSKEKISVIANKFYDLRDELEHVRDVKSFAIFRTKSLKFLNFVRTLFEEIWVQFDSFLMSRGLVLSFLLLAFAFIIIEGIPKDEFTRVLDNGFNFWAYGVVAFCALGSSILQYFRFIDDGILLMGVSSLTLSVFVMAVTVVQHWTCITVLSQQLCKAHVWTELVPRFLWIFSLLLYFSNSFVVEEAQVLLFLLNSSVFVIIGSLSVTSDGSYGPGKIRREEKPLWKKLLLQPRVRAMLIALLFSCLLRVSLRYWRCREEQSWCIDVARKGTRQSVDILTTLVCLALFVTAVRIWLRSCGNLVGFSPGVTLARYAPTVMVVCTGGYWVLQGLPRDSRAWQQQLLPWTVFTLVALGFVAIVWEPLCVYVVQKKADCLSVYGRENIIPQLFHQMKKEIGRGMTEKSLDGDAPVVYGLGTAFSAVFVILAENVCLLFVLLLGDVLAPSAVLLVAAALILLFFLAYVRLESSLILEQMLHTPWSYVITWGLLSSYFFYGTGHQPTIPNIHWYAAFVGTSGTFSNNVLPAFLIGVNTFCSQALAGLLLPMLLIAPFTLMMMLPRWLPLSCEKEVHIWKEALWSELKQGELVLFEREGSMQYSAFKLAAKYILFHATRVITCMLAAAFHCRHLMVWKIFAPRFIFEGLGFFVTLATVLLSYLILGRISTKISNVVNRLLSRRGG